MQARCECVQEELSVCSKAEQNVRAWTTAAGDGWRRAKCQSELHFVDGKAALHTHCTYEEALTEKAFEWYTCRL